MADDRIVLNPGSGGDIVDAESVTIGVETRKRSRVVLAGTGAGEIARVTNAHPGSSDYGLVTRVTGPVVVVEFANAQTWVGTRNAAPAANAVQADTGPLPAGDYEFTFHMAVADTVAVGKGLVIEYRDGLNSTTKAVLGGCPASSSTRMEVARMTLLLNERVRIVAGTAAGATGSMYISAIGRRLLP